MKYSNYRPIASVIFLALSISAMRADAEVPVSLSIIGRTLETLSGLEASDPTGDKAIKLINDARLPNNVILQHFYSTGKPLQDVTPERLAKIAEVEEALSPYIEDLINVMKRAKSSRTEPNAAATLLAFAPATQAVKRSLEDLADDESASPVMAGQAYNALFMLGLDDEALRQKVISKFTFHRQKSTKAELADYLLGGASLRWPFPEARDYFSNLLSVKLQSENYPDWGGRPALLADLGMAVRAFARYGMLAKEVIPLLEARRSELDETDESEASLRKEIVKCIERLNGEDAPELAMNWKGELLGVNKAAVALWNKRHGTTAGPGAQRIFTNASAPSIAGEIEPSPVPHADIAEAESKHAKWPWVAGIVALIIVVWIRLKHRS